MEFFSQAVVLFLIGVVPLLAVYRTYRGSPFWGLVSLLYTVVALNATGPIAEYMTPFVVLPPIFLLIAVIISDMIDTLHEHLIGG